jgi:hypothetical protein
MNFVIIEKNQASIPSSQDITKAVSESGGAVTTVQGGNASKRVDYTGTVNHTVFENKLIQVAKGKRTSWNFDWADAEVSRHANGNGNGNGNVSVNGNGNGLSARAAGGIGVGQLEATQYEIDITMSPATVTALVTGNYNLYGFKAVQAAQGGGAPLVWFQLPTTGYSTLTQLTWSVQYQAYTSNSNIIPSGRVVASFATDIDLGQTLNVQAGGVGDVTQAGPPQAISIHNTTTTPFTCGISQQAADGSTNPMCAFPLYGQQLDVVAPIEKVLLLFSTLPVNTGTVIEQAYSPGVLVDLTSTNQRAVSYDINLGWSWGGYSWAQPVGASENIIPLLIETAAAQAGAAVEPRSLVFG